MNTIRKKLKKYVLIYPEYLSEDDQERIVRLSSADTSLFISSQSSSYFYIIELLSECGYDLVGYQSSGLIIETRVQLTMLYIDREVMILEANDDFFEKLEQHNEVLRKHSNIVDHLNRAIIAAGDYSSSYVNTFDEYSEISDEFGWDEIVGSLNEERESLIEKIRESIDGYIARS